MATEEGMTCGAKHKLLGAECVALKGHAGKHTTAMGNQWDESMCVVKPPLGIMPFNLWVEKRMTELVLAMSRYIEAELEYPADWEGEYVMLYNWKNE